LGAVEWGCRDPNPTRRTSFKTKGEREQSKVEEQQSQANAIDNAIQSKQTKWLSRPTKQQQQRITAPNHIDQPSCFSPSKTRDLLFS
jgi:hypothetical protein